MKPFTIATFIKHNGLLLLTTAVTALANPTPYVLDTYTRNLWHFDEGGGALYSEDAVPGGATLTAIRDGASLGNTSLDGFGLAASTYDAGPYSSSAENPNGVPGRDAYLAPLPLVNGTGDNSTLDFTGTDGAFTIEALLRVDFDPTYQSFAQDASRRMQIVSADSEEAVRLFQFLMLWNELTDPTPEIKFINIGGTIQPLTAVVPVSGPNAIASNGWYHVAVTYNGQAGTADNFKFYWTKVDGNRVEADLLASQTMNNDLTVGSADWAIGNDGRGTTDQNWVGLIDEVRLSSVARQSDDFIFLPVAILAASGFQDEPGEYHPPEHTLDGDLGTRWAALGDGEWIAYDLGQEEVVSAVGIAFLAGDTCTSTFDLQVSNDGIGWTDVLPGAVSSGTSFEVETFNFLPRHARYVRIVGHGNSQSFWNRYSEVDIQHARLVSSDPNDTDADGLLDAWEWATFGSLAQSATDDFDGDWYKNKEEWDAGTDPRDANSHKMGRRIRLVPVDDGDPNTSEYARSGGINTASFIRSSIRTVGNQQFLTYYGRHETDANYALNDTLWVARRTVGANVWDVTRTSFTADDITDGHDCISFGIDGLGYMHLSWGMHATGMHYAKSLTPVIGKNTIAFGPNGPMTSWNKNLVTYPQFLNLPNGDLLYFFRYGGSGNGDLYLNRYSLASQTWSNVHLNSGGTPLPFIKGRDFTPNYNAYWQRPCIDENGTIHMIWMWRYNADSPAGESGYQTNHDFDYAWSPDGGTTWKRNNGANYVLPINESGENGNTNSIAEKVLSIPEGYSLINQAGMCVDRSNQPVLVSWWAPGSGTNNYRRQYMVGFPGTNGWETRQISFRTIDSPTKKIAESELGTSRMGRPTIVCDKDDRLIVIYNDNEGANGITVVHSLPKALDPERLLWTKFDLTTNSVGAHDTFHVDDSRWEQDNELHMFYLSPSSGNTAAPIGVLEWDAATYFAHQPAQHLTFTTGGADAVISFPTQTGWEYRLWSNTNLTENAWQQIGTVSGNDEVREIIHTNGGAGPQKFWQLEIKEGGFDD